ncbi:MAG: hypothetical protein BWY66_02903 [bacterium ADurb.Bin374]|nr:MAG: hypothetical protein BWY66_02903 [bacterium ADurb.Bin374]
MHARDIVPAFLLTVALLSAAPSHAEDPRPWESPTTGFTSGTSGTTGSPEKIETIINTTGGTRTDGAQVTNSGTSDQQSFVNGFLNDAATKIKEAGGGTGWAWTWEKKWKIGPDGKPYEVKETWAEGNIGIESKPETAPATPAPAPSPTPSPTTAVTGTTDSPESPTTSSQPSATTAPSASSAPSKSSTPSTPAATSAAKPAASPASSAPTTAPKGIDAAPAKIPEPPVILTIFDPISQQECRYAAAINPSKPGRVPLVASITRPIFEDTRVKIALDLGTGIDGNDLSVTIRDNEGDHAFEHGSFPANYRHIFRVPNQKDYTARVVYKHPVSKESQEIINVQIPVLKMSFANRTVESAGARTEDPDLSTRPGGSASSDGGSGSSSSGTTGWGASTGTIKRDASAGGESQTYDLSDLYTDPANPPEVAGDQKRSADASRADTAGQGVGEPSHTGGTSSTDAGTEISGSKGGSSGHRADADTSDGQQTSSSGMSDSNATNNGAADRIGSPRSGSGESSGAGESGNLSHDETSGSGSGAAMAGQRQEVSGNADTGSPARSEAAATQDTSYAMAQDTSEAGSTSTEPATGEDRAKNAGGIATASVQQDAKPYLLSVSIQNRATNGAQSFDFNTDPTPTAQSISPQTPLAISVDFAQNVLRDSVKIEIFDGRDRITTSPSEMKSGVVEHIFENPTTDAYVWVYGRTDQAPFSYKVLIPVTGL